MQAIVDTATDLVAIQGIDCTECTGDKYNITNGIENGVASLDSSLNSTVAYGE